MYTIKRAARVTGVPPATLRAWERRYGIGPTHRTEAGYRLYDEASLRALTRMASLIAQGWSARQAAEEALSRPALESASTAPPPEPSSTTGPSPTSPSSRMPDPAATAHPSRRSEPTADALDDLVDPAARLDAGGLTAALDERFATASFEVVVDRWLMPSLIGLGDAWAQGRVSVAGEHLASSAVMRRLAAAYDAAATTPAGARLVVGLPAGVRHELGVLSFAVAARRAGLNTTYLGADLPAEDWVAAVSAHDAHAVVMAALRVEDLPALSVAVDALRASRPGLVIGVGGAKQDSAPPGCLALGHEIGTGVRLLTQALTQAAASAKSPTAVAR